MRLFAWKLIIHRTEVSLLLLRSWILSHNSFEWDSIFRFHFSYIVIYDSKMLMAVTVKGTMFFFSCYFQINCKHIILCKNNYHCLKVLILRDIKDFFEGPIICWRGTCKTAYPEAHHVYVNIVCRDNLQFLLVTIEVKYVHFQILSQHKQKVLPITITLVLYSFHA